MFIAQFKFYIRWLITHYIQNAFVIARNILRIASCFYVVLQICYINTCVKMVCIKLVFECTSRLKYSKTP